MRQKTKNADHLKQVLNSCWNTISQELIDGAIEQWFQRLWSVVCSCDGHIEHCFFLSICKIGLALLLRTWLEEQRCTVLDS